MPEGMPKTEEERKETHKEIYGTEDIPKRRGFGDVRKKLSWGNRAEHILDVVLIIVLVCLLVFL
jgi:hypothetical protein